MQSVFAFVSKFGFQKKAIPVGLPTLTALMNSLLKEISQNDTLKSMFRRCNVSKIKCKVNVELYMYKSCSILMEESIVLCVCI